jgi:hypothetical protein
MYYSLFYEEQLGSEQVYNFLTSRDRILPVMLLPICPFVILPEYSKSIKMEKE